MIAVFDGTESIASDQHLKNAICHLIDNRSLANLTMSTPTKYLAGSNVNWMPSFVAA